MGLQNTNARDDTTMRCFFFRIDALVSRELNPRFLMHHFGQKTGFRARNAGMNVIKSGIPCSACIFVNYLQRWVYKIQTHAMTRRCVAFFVK
jgi:hypothetical protein